MSTTGQQPSIDAVRAGIHAFLEQLRGLKYEKTPQIVRVIDVDNLLTEVQMTRVLCQCEVVFQAVDDDPGSTDRFNTFSTVVSEILSKIGELRVGPVTARFLNVRSHTDVKTGPNWPREKW